MSPRSFCQMHKTEIWKYLIILTASSLFSNELIIHTKNYMFMEFLNITESLQKCTQTASFNSLHGLFTSPNIFPHKADL